MKLCYSSIFLFVAILFFSCKKEETHPAGQQPHYFTLPPDSVVDAVPLNGGNISGRWSITYERQLEYMNDSLFSQYTDTFALGEGYIFFHGSDYAIWFQQAQTDTGTYVVNGSSLTLQSQNSGTIDLTYGVNNQSLRLHSSSVDIQNNITYKTYEDDIGQRW